MNELKNKCNLYNKEANSKKSLASQLMQVPRKEKRKNAPITDPATRPGFIHQADLLFLPTDRRFKYALVVVDIGSRLVDAEPLKSKRQAEIVEAFQTIYKRGPLAVPKVLLQTDSGKEFEGLTLKYFQGLGVGIRYGLPGRHRSQAVVEAYNGVIARSLFHDMLGKELRMKRIVRAWTKNLPEVVKLINAHQKAQGKVREKKLREAPLEIRCEGDTCNVLPVGTKVRVMEDTPVDVKGKKLHGKFRVTDMRWGNQVRTIVDQVFRPYQPPMYKVSGVDLINYTKNQLQVVK